MTRSKYDQKCCDEFTDHLAKIEKLKYSLSTAESQYFHNLSVSIGELQDFTDTILDEVNKNKGKWDYNSVKAVADTVAKLSTIVAGAGFGEARKFAGEGMGAAGKVFKGLEASIQKGFFKVIEEEKLSKAPKSFLNEVQRKLIERAVENAKHEYVIEDTLKKLGNLAKILQKCFGCENVKSIIPPSDKSQINPKHKINKVFDTIYNNTLSRKLPPCDICKNIQGLLNYIDGMKYIIQQRKVIFDDVLTTAQTINANLLGALNLVNREIWSGTAKGKAANVITSGLAAVTPLGAAAKVIAEQILTKLEKDAVQPGLENLITLATQEQKSNLEMLSWADEWSNFPLDWELWKLTRYRHGKCPDPCQEPEKPVPPPTITEHGNPLEEGNFPGDSGNDVLLPGAPGAAAIPGSPGWTMIPGISAAILTIITGTLLGLGAWMLNNINSDLFQFGWSSLSAYVIGGILTTLAVSIISIILGFVAWKLGGFGNKIFQFGWSSIIVYITKGLLAAIMVLLTSMILGFGVWKLSGSGGTIQSDNPATLAVTPIGKENTESPVLAMPAADDSVKVPTSTLTPTATQTPTITMTPTPTITPTPTPLLVVGQDDGTDDGVNCLDGQSAPEIPASFQGVDLTNVEAKKVNLDGTCYFQFTLTFAQPVSTSAEIWGGIELYSSNAPLLSPYDSSWFFNNTGNHSFNFHWSGSSLDLMFSYVTQDGTTWSSAQVPEYIGAVNGNQIILRIPCELLSNFPEDATWFATATPRTFDICEEIGLGKDGLPALFLPADISDTVEPFPPTNTPTPRPVEISYRIRYYHTKPGSYSNVYVEVTGPPGTTVSATLKGPAVSGSKTQTATIGSNGAATLTWKITSYGTYTATGSIGNTSFTLTKKVTSSPDK